MYINKKYLKDKEKLFEFQFPRMQQSLPSPLIHIYECLRKLFSIRFSYITIEYLI